MRKYIKHIVATLVLMGGLMVNDLYAPPTGGAGGVSGGGAACWPPPCIPVDGGIAILMIAGAAIASRKLIAR